MTCFSRLIDAALLLGITGCPPPPDFSAPRTPKAHLWTSGSVRQGNLPTAAKVVQLGWEFSLVIYPGSTPVGNATLVVANVLTCNKYSQNTRTCRSQLTEQA
jgi:hypothetical protein